MRRKEVLTNMELWAEVRRRVLTGELSRRQAAKEFQLNYRTIEKIVGNVEPPGYRGGKPRKRPRMEKFLPLIAEILEGDKNAPKKQRHTAQRTGARQSNPTSHLHREWTPRRFGDGDRRERFSDPPIGGRIADEPCVSLASQRGG